MTTATAAIRIRGHGADAALEYRRADVGSLLRNKHAEEALLLLPRLLPVCAQAQQIAAARALEAARGKTESVQDQTQREASLLREQALAAAWRLAVDWPRSMGEAPDLKYLKVLRRSSNSELAMGLEALLPQVLRGDAAALTDGEELISHLEASDPDTLAGRVIMQAKALALPVAAALECLSGQALWERASPTLSVPMAQSGAIDLSCAPQPVTVGPLSMGRGPGIPALLAWEHSPVTLRLLLAALLDTVYLVQRLRVEVEPRGIDLSQRVLAPGMGVGHAITSRGPLYHCIGIGEDRRIRHWRYLAPTDWHFAVGGLVDRLVKTCRSQHELTLLVTAADPCARWDYRADGVDKDVA